MSKCPLIIVDSSTFSPVFSLSLPLCGVSPDPNHSTDNTFEMHNGFPTISWTLSRLSAADNSLYYALELTISANRLLPCQSHFKFPIRHTHIHTHTHIPPQLNSMVHLLIRAHLVNSKYRYTNADTQWPGVILHTNRSIHPSESMLLGNKPLRANR